MRQALLAILVLSTGCIDALKSEYPERRFYTLSAQRPGEAVPPAKDSVLRLAPPLCISAGEVDELAELVAETVSELQDEVTRSARGRVAAA